MATIEELLARIERIEKTVYKKQQPTSTKGLETSRKIHAFVKEYAKANRVVPVKAIARQMKLSEARVWSEFLHLTEDGVIESLGKGIGYISKVYESK
jgi:hypothetical protein